MSDSNPVRYRFTNTTDKDIFLSGVNITIKAHQSVIFTPVEIDDIEEYYDYPEVLDGSIAIEIVGEMPTGIDYRAGEVIFGSEETSKEVIFSVPMSSTNYAISLIANDNVNVYYENQTQNGFVVNISSSGDGIVVKYIAIAYR